MTQVSEVARQIGPQFFAGHKTCRGALDLNAALSGHLSRAGRPLTHKNGRNNEATRQFGRSTMFALDVISKLHDAIISDSLQDCNSEMRRAEISAPLSNGGMAATAAENRRAHLAYLKQTYGTWERVNERLHRKPTDATLSQIHNQVISKGARNPRQMGDELARSIEKAMGWGRGHMDRPLGPEHAQQPNTESLTDDERRLLAAFRDLLQDAKQRVLADVDAIAEQQRRLAQEVLSKHFGVKSYVTPERAAEKLPPAPVIAEAVTHYRATPKRRSKK